jgi:hypothetical protein
MQSGFFWRFGIETEILLSRRNTLAVEIPENIPETILSTYKAVADPGWPRMHLDIDGSYTGDSLDEWSLTDDVTIVPGEGQSKILSAPPKRTF